MDHFESDENWTDVLKEEMILPDELKEIQGSFYQYSILYSEVMACRGCLLEISLELVSYQMFFRLNDLNGISTPPLLIKSGKIFLNQIGSRRKMTLCKYLMRQEWNHANRKFIWLTLQWSRNSEALSTFSISLVSWMVQVRIRRSVQCIRREKSPNPGCCANDVELIRPSVGVQE